MATAKEELERANRGEGPLGKAHRTEPVFILRGQDMHAADLVDKWACFARVSGAPPDKVREAEQLAQDMRDWTIKKFPD